MWVEDKVGMLERKITSYHANPKKAGMLIIKIEFEHVHESNLWHGKSENNIFTM